MKNVLLLGIYGTYNYGCEAIVRGTVEILKRYNPDINISYASYDYQTDIKKLRDLDINIIKRPNIFKKWSLQNIKWKILRLLNVTRTRPFDTTDWIQNFDTIFSIGGDMYTLGSDNSYRKSLPKFFEECKQKGLKYILWGASVGPFDKNPEALQFYKSHLANADLIVSREEATTSYLEKIEINDNVTFAPDPAFYVPGPIKNISSSNEITQIGINLSYLSATHTYPTIEEAINKQAQTIEMIIDQFDCNITLLPHVVSPRYWEDDTAYLQKVKDAVNPSKQKKITLITEDTGFIGIKSILREMDLVITARMHCGINAICTGIPTIFLSYSAKAKGMCKLIYGDDKNVVPLEKFSDYSYIINLIKNKKVPNIENIKNFDFSSVLKQI